MAIIYNPNKKIFTLHTAHTTYPMQVDSLGYLLHLYYGDKTNGFMDYLLTYAATTGFRKSLCSWHESYLFAGCASTGVSFPWNRGLP